MTEPAIDLAPLSPLSPPDATLVPLHNMRADEDPYLVYLGRLGSDHSRRTMRGCLDRLARLLLGVALNDTTVEVTGAGLTWSSLRYQHTARLRALMLDAGWSAAHTNKHLVALRQVLREAWRLGLMTAEDYHRAVDIENVRASTLAAGRALAPDEIAALLDFTTAAGTNKGIRDAALIALTYTTGARRSELVAVNLDDWDGRHRVLRLRGKGNRQRENPVAPWAARYLDGWLALRGRLSGPLSCGPTRAGRSARLGYLRRRSLMW